MKYVLKISLGISPVQHSPSAAAVRWWLSWKQWQCSDEKYL